MGRFECRTIPWSTDYHTTKFTFAVEKVVPDVLVLSKLNSRYFRGLCQTDEEKKLRKNFKDAKSLEYRKELRGKLLKEKMLKKNFAMPEHSRGTSNFKRIRSVSILRTRSCEKAAADKRKIKENENAAKGAEQKKAKKADADEGAKKPSTENSTSVTED
ncbi:hypothetical protein BJ878DRAFT_578690 [Calycina marina]|uniref:Uncharacterized protein n=1 Tax=Calycina marina TaxID=1763456 RepID=A0A9P8CBS5_9HELO|nr:hypothetical protein BJ878DRAFT_578690 [Calycina marina]